LSPETLKRPDVNREIVLKWVSGLQGEFGFMVTENVVLMEIFQTKGDKLTGWRGMHNI
jgi:hypothetical protein